MDFVKRWWTQIQVTMSQLNLATKMLIATLCVMMLAALVLVALYAGQPELVPLLNQPLSQDQLAQYAAYLDQRQVRYEVRGGQVLVPPDRRLELLAQLQLNKMLPDDTSRSFDELAARHTWWQSRDQSRQLYQIAKQNVLGKVIAKMRGVAGATVIISQPEQRGFDATYKRPSASVNVVMAQGQVDQKLVDAVAGLVAGAVAEMRPEDVTVIDALAGRQWKVRSDEQLVAGDYMEFVQQTERLIQNKIASALAYIPKVIVAVNVEADIKRRTINEQKFNRDDSVELVSREMTRSQVTQAVGAGGEPGVRSNTGAEIPGALGGNGQSQTKETETEFDTHPGQVHTVTIDPGGVLKRINATVNIPRSYFVGIFRQARPAGDPAQASHEPTDEQLKPLIAEYTDRIRKQVEPLLAAQTPGQLWVDVYPDAALSRDSELAAAGLAGGGPLGLLGEGMVQRIGLGVLAVLSLGLMLLMIRSGTRRQVTTSPAELAGIPPTLMPEEMVIGEADETEAPLPGMELDENQLRTRKLVKQVSELVHANPDEVVNLVQRWVRRTE